MKKLCSTFALLLFCLTTYAADQFVTFRKADGAFQIIGSGKVVNILLDEKDQKGIGIAVNNLIEDFNRVCGMKPQLLKNTSSENCIIVGSLESTYIKQLIKSKNSIRSNLRIRMRSLSSLQ